MLWLSLLSCIYVKALYMMQGDGVEIVIINKDGIRRESMPLKRD
jgi:hypothetical protein